MLRFIVAASLSLAAAVCVAQSEGERGSVPPGESRDESRPAEGAIKGGSIEGDLGSSRAPAEDIARCKELTGTLREQCLRDLGAGAAGGTRPPPRPPSSVPRDPIAEPPPQNPRESR